MPRYLSAMASLLIRNLDDGLKSRLRVRAAEHGRSMEEEARTILRSALSGSGDGRPVSLAQLARDIFGPEGVEIDVPPREPSPEPPDFGA